MRTKPTVEPPLVHALAALSRVSSPVDIVITAAVDGVHQRRSLHYSLRAVDIRSKTFPSPEAKRAFIEAVLRELGPGWQMFLEAEGQPNEHFHLEYDPA